MSANGNSSGAAAAPFRSRLPRWTRHETLVLVQAKHAAEHGGSRPKRPKWVAVSAYCRRHGVERGPMQCRKRWGNLSWDLKKIVGWEKNTCAAAAATEAQQHESFWDMGGEQRRARQLPSSFDREVYDALVRTAAEAGEEVVDDEAKMSDFGEELAEEEWDERPPALMVMPISARKYEPPASSARECSDPGTKNDKKAAGDDASDKNSNSQQDGLKQSDSSIGAGAEGTKTMGKQVLKALERGNRVVAAQLEAQKKSWVLDREQRKGQVDGLLTVLTKLADAVGRIADKL